MGDYDRKPMEPPSQWLRLKSKDQQARIRIAAAPYRELKVWPAGEGKKQPIAAEMVQNLTPGQWMTVMRDPNFDVNEIFHFAVIDRADGIAKIFTTTGGVYGQVKSLAEDPEWGDPKQYDITVTRTEQPGKNYYSLLASPNKSQLTSEELAKVDGLNIAKRLPAARPAAAPQPDDFGQDTRSEPVSWISSEGPAAPAQSWDNPAPQQQQNTDIVIEDIGDEPINLDDIPF